MPGLLLGSTRFSSAISRAAFVTDADDADLNGTQIDADRRGRLFAHLRNADRRGLRLGIAERGSTRITFGLYGTRISADRVWDLRDVVAGPASALSRILLEALISVNLRSVAEVFAPRQIRVSWPTC